MGRLNGLLKGIPGSVTWSDSTWNTNLTSYGGSAFWNGEMAWKYQVTVTTMCFLTLLAYLAGGLGGMGTSFN